MIYNTYSDISNKVKRDLDLQDEVFISPEEMLGYANEAIAECEAEIHTIYEDYFLTYADLDIVNGQDLYTLPTTMYADKIRKVIYRNGSNNVGKGRIFTVDRMRGPSKFELEMLANEYASNELYRYMLVNNSASTVTDTPNMLVVPTPNEDLPGGFKIWFLRSANRMVDDTSVVDIPEFEEFVMQHMKVRCYEKEGHPNIELGRVDLERHRQMMRDTLSNRVPDDDTRIPLDISTYDEMS